MARPLRSVEERFAESYIPEPNTGCFLWTRQVDKNGYGDFIVRKIPLGDGRYQKERIKAHRLAWELHRGSVPDEMDVCHSCDITSCVNPDHLFLGTAADNSADMVAKERQARGESLGRSKLTEADVLAIRASSETQAKLAERYGVVFQTISDIQRRVTWRHI